MFKYPILFFFTLFFFFSSTKAQQLTKLVGYEETASDSFGAMLNYTAYWNNFSGNRGSTITHSTQVGFTHYDFFTDISAADTTWAVTIHSSGTYKDSSMKIWKYDSNNNPLVSKKYTWNSMTLSWTPYAVEKDSFIYSANQLVARYYFQYDIVTSSFKNTNSYMYTYNTSGKLISEIHIGIVKTEYTWSGNDMTSEKTYEWISGAMWRLQGELATTYVNYKPITQKSNGWYYTNNNPIYYDQLYDSNIYNGNILTNKYSRYAGYYTAKYPFNYRESYQYDVDGNVSEIIFAAIDSFGTWINDRKMEFTYNNDNNPVLIKHYDTLAGNWKLAWRGNITTKRYHYLPFPTSVVTTHTKNEFSLYPSPAQHSINLKTAFKQETNCTVAIVDIQGTLQRQWAERIPPGSSVTTIPIGNLPTGTYLLRLSSSVETVIKEFNVIR